MANDREERIRRRAHEIWEREGRPHGRHQEHWQQALREVSEGDPEAAAMESMRGSSSDPSRPAAKRRKAAAAGEAAPKARTAKGSGEAAGQGGQPDTALPAPKGRRSAAAAQGGGSAASPGRARRSAKSTQAE